MVGAVLSDRFGSVGVVGAGAMGRGIAQVAAQAGASVTLTDVTPDAAESAKRATAASLDRAVEKGRMTRSEADATLARIAPGADPRHHAEAELIIEAAVENIDVKAAIFRQLASAAPDAILATNTSSLSVAAIARASGARVIGLHFFNPAHVMPLVEVVLPEAAAPLRDRLDRTLQAWGKTPVAAPDSPGFIVNRVARPFYGEALAMLEEGADPGAIDAALEAAGYRMGPLALIDLVGADINLAASESVADAMSGHPRYHVFDALRDQVAAGRLGRKSGSGFVTPAGREAAPLEGAVERIEATVVNEAASLLEAEGVTEKDIDTAMKLGLNFPRGPFEIVARAGARAIVERLDAMEARAPEHLKGRYVPTPPLRAMAAA